MKLDEKVLNILIKDAEQARKKGEIPVSAVILDQGGHIVSHACNNRQRSFNVLGHAEIIAILKAEKKLKDWRLDGYKMVVVLEPCDMCSMVISKSRIDEVYFFISQKNQDVSCNVEVNKKMIDGYDDQKSYFEGMLLNFFNNMR